MLWQHMASQPWLGSPTCGEGGVSTFILQGTGPGERLKLRFGNEGAKEKKD